MYVVINKTINIHYSQIHELFENDINLLLLYVALNDRSIKLLISYTIYIGIVLSYYILYYDI